MADKSVPTPDQLRQMLTYDPETGSLFWKIRCPSMFSGTKGRSREHCCANWNSRYAETEAFTHLHSTGYKKGAVFNKKYNAHRVAWAIYYGVWPSLEIDHINGVRHDNRISNLREVRRWQNNANSKLRCDNTSGIKGVCLDRRTGKWLAQIGYEGRHKVIGAFSCKDDAAKAYADASERYHGEFRRSE